jgi:two-component system, NtrC family, sensor kinase
MWRKIRESLFPGEAERDPGFRREIYGTSRTALLVIGGIQIGVAIFMLAARFVVEPQNATLPFRLRQGAAVIGLGLLNILLSRIPRIDAFARFIAAMSAMITATFMIWVSLMVLSESTNPDDFIPGQITLIMLVVVTCVPLRPMQTMWLGLGIGAVYLGSTLAAQRYLFEGTGPDDNYMLFIVMLTFLSTGITAVVYHQRRANYALRENQARMLLAENASSLARLAAALSHELNNPMGALLSGVDTLLLLASKQATCSPQEQTRLVVLQADIRKSIQQSAERLRQLIARMQRFTNLDQADVQSADVNELLGDVVALMEPCLAAGTQVTLDLGELPPLVCRPRQISAVLSSLVTNAVEAVDGQGCVWVASREIGDRIEIDIRDTGRGLKPGEVESIFDPAFKVSSGRVGTGNWSMFSARQIIREHGGDISIDSSPAKGTLVRIALPLETRIAA